MVPAALRGEDYANHQKSFREQDASPFLLPATLVATSASSLGNFPNRLFDPLGESLHCALLLDYVPPEEPPSRPLGNVLRIK